MAKMNQVLFVSIIVLTFGRYCALRALRKNSEQETKKHVALAKYFCHLYSTCTHGGSKVCGYDEESSYLAQFEDRCTLLQVNCKGDGTKIFFQVQNQVCDVKTKFEYQYHNEASEFEHLSTTEKPEYNENSSVKTIIKTTKKRATTQTTKEFMKKFKKFKWKTKPEILIHRRGIYIMPFLK